MDLTTLAAVFVVAIALFFDFTNGFHDSANLTATVIVSRALAPKIALLLAAVAEFVGAYFLGTAVAETIGGNIVDPRLFHDGTAGIVVIASALIGATVWNFITWYFGMPSSSSHALIGGLLGAFILAWGTEPINWIAVGRIVAVMIASPIVGFVLTYFFTRLTIVFSEWASPKANNTFRKLQVISSITQALSHGTNDAQKTMGVITFALITLGLYAPPQSGSILIPSWVIAAASAAIALGTFTGGWRIIKKLGAGLFRIRPIHGFASQTTSTIIIYLTALFGFPISTTQVISSSVMGTGAASRPRMVRWKVAQDMVRIWFVTIPASALTAGAVYFALKSFFNL